MSRVNLPGSQPFYDAAAAFVELCLREDRSLFTPGVAIWTRANLDELHRRFNQSPDASGGSFEQKFQRQLAGAEPAIYQLAAELIYVHLLIARGTINGGAKRLLIRRVLGWSPQPVAIPPERDAALDAGLARVGTAFLTYRPFQLWFLIDAVRAWKELPSDAERERLLADPWAFKAFVFALPIDRAYAQREALLHLVHPDSFEAIVSRDHKRSYVEQFRAYVTAPSGDVDRDLKQIRIAVDQRYGPGHNLYAISDGSISPLPTAGPLPRTLGAALKPYVRLVALLDAPSYTPAQIVERLGRVSPPVANLAAPPDAEALVGDLLRLRLLQPIEGGGYRRWGYLDGAIESQVLRYAALTLLVPLGDGSHELPALRAPLDGEPHPASAWPFPELLLPWYEEAGLARPAGDDRWQALPDALSPLPDANDCARALNRFLGYFNQARHGQVGLPPLADEPLPPLDPAVLEERIAEIQRELLIDRSTILRIYRALIAGQHVILSGPPGTGKTHLARLLPRVLWRDADSVEQLTLGTDPRVSPVEPPAVRQVFRDGYVAEVVTATEDWGVRNVIGGITPQVVRENGRTALVYQVRHGSLTRAILSNYAGYDGIVPPPTFQRQDVLERDARCRGRWLVIDEFTRAPIDAAFGSLLTTLGGQRSPLAVPTDDGEALIPLPRDFRIIGTLNSFDRHFLNQISEAMKRRFTFIDVLPPGRALANAERGAAATRALLRLGEQELLDVGVEQATGRVSWEEVVTIARSTPEAGGVPNYTFDWHDSEAAAAFDTFWRIFGAIRVYRQLGTAQAEAVCGALFSGHVIGMAWNEALDSGLADTLADQLQVLARDEQRVLLAYLDHAGDADRFAAQLRRVLGGLPAARQAAHLAQLRSADAEPGDDPIDELEAARLSPAQLGRLFHLGSSLIVGGRGLFAQRLRAFVGERGL